jgi:hypothetical protein
MADDHPILSGTPEEKIKAWLQVDRNEDGHLEQGVSYIQLSSTLAFTHPLSRTHPPIKPQTDPHRTG